MTKQGVIPKISDLDEFPLRKFTSNNPKVTESPTQYIEFEFLSIKLNTLQRKAFDEFYEKVGSVKPFTFTHDSTLYVVRFGAVTRITDNSSLVAEVSWALIGFPKGHSRMTEFLRAYQFVFEPREIDFLEKWHAQKCFPEDARVDRAFIEATIGADYNSYNKVLQNSGLSQHHHLRLVKYSYYYAGMAYNKNAITMAHVNIIDLFCRKLLKHVVPAIHGAEPSWQQQEEWIAVQKKIIVRVVQWVVKAILRYSGVQKLLDNAENAIMHDEDTNFNQDYSFDGLPDIGTGIEV